MAEIARACKVDRQRQPPAFQPGEAFQFDWTRTGRSSALSAKASGGALQAQLQPGLVVRAYLLQTHQMLFDAHNHAFRVLGGVPRRGIYDNRWTPPGRGNLLATFGIGCVNLSGLSLERSRPWP